MAKEKKDNPDQIPIEPVPATDTKPVLDERWFVEEMFPERYDPIMGMVVPESWHRNYSEVFATEKEANSYIATHVPDYEGGKFRKAHEVQREVCTVQWMPA